MCHLLLVLPMMILPLFFFNVQFLPSHTIINMVISYTLQTRILHFLRALPYSHYTSRAHAHQHTVTRMHTRGSTHMRPHTCGRTHADAQPHAHMSPHACTRTQQHTNIPEIDRKFKFFFIMHSAIKSVIVK